MTAQIIYFPVKERVRSKEQYLALLHFSVNQKPMSRSFVAALHALRPFVVINGGRAA